MRKLASIQTISGTEPIEGADRIELAHVLGWQCVVPKGQVKAGDLVVYFEVDAFLPVGDERWDFLGKTSYKKNEISGEGYRIRTQKFRGVLSQGLVLPVSLFPELEGHVGNDVTETLGVKKWEIPEQTGSAGTVIGVKPFGIPTTDETRVQSDDSLRERLLGKPYIITTKMDGTSCTMYFLEGQFGVCGRNYSYADDGKCSMWNYAHEHHIPEKMTDVVLQGEFCGAGIQKNRLCLKTPEWYVFNAFDSKMNFLGYYEMKEICDRLGLKTVPLEEEGDSFGYSLDELLEKAKGKYPSGRNKEGIVVRPLYPEGNYYSDIGKVLSFKVLNNEYLLKE